jgi:hypothetical protein
MTVNQSELARACYEAWSKFHTRYGIGHLERWDSLGGGAQKPWMMVAEAAARYLSEQADTAISDESRRHNSKLCPACVSSDRTTTHDSHSGSTLEGRRT